MDADERSSLGQATVLRDRALAIRGSPSLHFIHVALPHYPWTLSRTGVRTSHFPPGFEPESPAFEFLARQRFQLHSMQVGAADALIGELVDHLRSMGSWDDTLLVVMSDHGLGIAPPDLGRTLTEQNREEMLRMPLFIKAPGQRRGEVRDDVAQTIDVMPSIVDLLGIRTNWSFDGHSLYDGSESNIAPKVSADVAAAIAVAKRHADRFPYGDDWVGLAAVGENGDLVGRSVGEFAQGPPSDYRATLSQAALLTDLPANGTMPFVLTGRLATPADDERQPRELLAAINGVFAGVIGGYQPKDGGWTFDGYVADLYRQGPNEVSLYDVERSGTEITLHEIPQG
jgi:hypothetical protein